MTKYNFWIIPGTYSELVKYLKRAEKAREKEAEEQLARIKKKVEKIIPEKEKNESADYFLGRNDCIDEMLKNLKDLKI